MAEPRTYSGNGHTLTIADPDNITRDECLALARCGADAWNVWRDEFPLLQLGVDEFRNTADFSGVDFRDNFIDFFGLRLGDHARFRGAVFDHQVNFVEHVFGRFVDFSGARFEYRGTFGRASFGHSVNFSGAVFGAAGADFEGASFGSWANFCSALFLGRANFQGARFGSFAFFLGTVFDAAAEFSAAKFGPHAAFMGRNWDVLSRQFENFTPTSYEPDNLKQLRPNAFSYCCFDGCEFEGVVNFSNREFLEAASFSTLKNEVRVRRRLELDGGDLLNSVEAASIEEFVFPEGTAVRFGLPPIFHGCKLLQDFAINSAILPDPTGQEQSIRAYRTLKLAFSQQQATREEQRFFRLEMAEEAKAAEGSRDPAKWLYIAYRELSDFGFSVRRPALLLGVALLLMLPLYAWQAGLQACWPTAAGCNMTGPLIQFASAHALPGFEKLSEPAGKLLFGKDLEGLGVWTVLTLLLHKAVSMLAIFLIGLALRNLFKMK